MMMWVLNWGGTMKRKGGLGDSEIDESSTEETESDSSKRLRGDLSKAPSFILVDTGTPHPELPGIKVRLRPYVGVKDGKINRIGISGRTPSPFGRAMGDHTVAWQAVVDELHAQLYGLTVDEAAAKLRTVHEHVAGWMLTRGTQPKVLLRELDDVASRWQRLEDATYNTQRLLTAISLGSEDSRQRSLLGRAIAYHLAYVNYLPFETVRAKSARGSHGSAEGRHRRVLVTWEKEGRQARLAVEEAIKDRSTKMLTDEESRQLDEQDVLRVEAEKERRTEVAPALRTSLWALLDLTAAVRESDMDFVLQPSSATDTAKRVQRIDELATELKQIAKVMQDNGTITTEKAARLQKIAEDVEKVPLKQDYKAISWAAGIVKGIALEVYSSIGTAAKNKSAGKKALNNKKLDPALADSAQVAEDIAAQSVHAPERAALVLSTVLRRHLTTLAAAYPNSVTACELLKPSPVSVAWDKLYAWLGASGFAEDLPGNTEVLKDLKTSFTVKFGTAEIKADGSDAWIDDAGNPGLVVSWNPDGPKMEVNGRAAAPDGVAGMGSHTTAWVVEVDALNAIIAGATSDAKRVEKLQEAVKEDLEGSVIKLDRLLPADQLEGSQLRDLFQTAADVLTATVQEDAARLYLEFRNLLPFATVDEGDRGGHGEGTDTSVKGRFDKKSLDVAAENVADALSDLHRVEALAVVMEATAKQLNAEAKKKKKTWPAEVQRAALESAKRLSRQSRALAIQVTNDKVNTEAVTADTKLITSVRWREHQMVYDLAYG
jgi:hypothetical protein